MNFNRGQLSNIFQFEASKSLQNKPETQITLFLETPCISLVKEIRIIALNIFWRHPDYKFLEEKYKVGEN